MNVIDKVITGTSIGKSDLKAFVGGYLSGEISREEMTSFLRAVCAHGMSDEDATYLTEVMLE